jgi:hypothetical protein
LELISVYGRLALLYYEGDTIVEVGRTADGDKYPRPLDATGKL